MLKDYFPLLLLLLAATGTAIFILVASALVSNRKRTKGKGTAYECGMPPVGDARVVLSGKDNNNHCLIRLNIFDRPKPK